VGCEGIFEPDENVRPDIGGYFSFSMVDSTYYASVNVMGCAMPTVMVNGDILSGSGCELHQVWGFPDTNLTLFPGDSVHVQVDFQNQAGNTETASLDIILPGFFAVTTPSDTGDIQIELGSPLTVAWTSSPGANYYYCYLHFFYAWYDSSGEEHWFNFNQNYTVTDTTITIGMDTLYPDLDQIASLNPSRNNYGHISLNAYSEPRNELGSADISTSGIIHHRQLNYIIE
jgi:hypothetical protein